VRGRDALPAEAEVRAAIAHLLRQAAANNAPPTATALAARLGISRPALYRHYRPMVDELLTAASGHEEPRRRRIRDRDGEIAKLRREKEDLRRHVELYEEIIRQLTVENDRLKQQLENQAGIAHMDSPHRV
jgi:DNA-binding transcriptional ArsR family regulator